MLILLEWECNRFLFHSKHIHLHIMYSDSQQKYNFYMGFYKAYMNSPHQRNTNRKGKIDTFLHYPKHEYHNKQCIYSLNLGQEFYILPLKLFDDDINFQKESNSFCKKHKSLCFSHN